MAKRTQSLMILPWRGGLNTSLNEALVQPNDTTIEDNVIVSISDEKRRREGINYNYDNAVFTVTHRESSGTQRTLKGTFTNLGILPGDLITIAGATEQDYDVIDGEVISISATELVYTGDTVLTESETEETEAYWANKVVGGIDYWFGSEDAKSQFIISVLDNGAVYAMAAGGTRSRVTPGGEAWATGITEANCEVIENKVIIAVSGLNNVVKYWDGDPTQPLQDLPSLFYASYGSPSILQPIASLNRTSAGTVRTIEFATPVDTFIAPGDTIIIVGGPAAYNGTFEVQTVSPNDTITYNASSSLTEGPIADTTMLVGDFAPRATFLRNHAGALWCNDKTRLDRLHYSGTDIFSWGGRDGLSGATDVGLGDDDPAGLTGIAPTFKGVLFVGKRTKLYRIDIPQGDFDLLQQTKVSNGIGFLSHQGITAVDQDDIFFVSDRGFHSLAATDAYGDFLAAFISRDIQKSFVEEFTPGRKKFIRSAYIPELNSVLYSVSENGSATNNAIYLYNIEGKNWRRWPNIESEAMISAQDTDRRRVYLGTYRARLAQTQTGFNRDIFFNGEDDFIENKIQTGLIYVDGRPDRAKQFKSIRVIFKASGSYTITCKVKIDNFSEQAFSFNSNENAIPLGTLVLGNDILGGSYVTAPYSLPVDGVGRGIRLTFEQNDLNTALALQGFIIEYWSGDTFQETRLADDR